MAIFNSYVSLPEGNHDSSEVLTHPQIYLWKIAEPCRASQSQQSSIRRPTKRADPCFPETMGFSPWKSHGKSMGNRWQQWNESSLVIHWWNWTPGKWSLIHGGSALLDREREREPPKASQVNGDLRGPIYKQQWLTIIQLHWYSWLPTW